MGVIESPDGTRFHLRANHLFGRSASADQVLPERRVSGRHAVIRWTGARWTVRDLGSTNGTLVDGRRLEPGTLHALSIGEHLYFGSNDAPWRIVETSAPATGAWPVLGGDLRQTDADMLALPDDDSPIVVLRSGDRGWVVEREGDVEPVRDGDIIDVDGVAWRLALPEASVSTEALDHTPRSLFDAHIEVGHSLDEETIHLIVRSRGTEERVEHRAHHELLLVLARQRLEDAARDDLPMGEHGWVHQDLLLKQLRSNPNALYQQVHRARRAFRDAGWPDAAHVVERRTGQMRLGLPNVSVAPLSTVPDPETP